MFYVIFSLKCSSGTECYNFSANCNSRYHISHHFRMNVCQYLPPTHLLLRYNVGAGGISCKLYDVVSVSANQLACDRRGISQTLTQPENIFRANTYFVFILYFLYKVFFNKCLNNEHAPGERF